MSEQQKYDELLDNICNSLDRAIEDETITDLAIRQKLSALSSFAEFIKAGADVRLDDLKDNIIKFNIILK